MCKCSFTLRFAVSDSNSGVLYIISGTRQFLFIDIEFMAKLQFTYAGIRIVHDKSQRVNDLNECEKTVQSYII
jgi:hypothetical protein